MVKCLRLKRMPGEGESESEQPRFMTSSASSSDLLFSPQPSHRAAADCEVLSLSPFAAAVAAVPFA